MRIEHDRRAGFTMIELIAVIVLVGALTIAAGMVMIPMVNAMRVAQQNVDSLQKAQFALARITRELTTVSNVVSGTARAMTYDTLDSTGQPHRHTLAWSGTAGEPVTLDGAPLTDDVSQFGLSYFAAPGSTPASTWSASLPNVRVVLGLGNTPMTFTNGVHMRNLP